MKRRTPPSCYLSEERSPKKCGFSSDPIPPNPNCSILCGGLSNPLSRRASALQLGGMNPAPESAKLKKLKDGLKELQERWDKLIQDFEETEENIEEKEEQEKYVQHMSIESTKNGMKVKFWCPCCERSFINYAMITALLIKSTSFSYCLVDRDSDAVSTLEFDSPMPRNAVTAPLLRNPELDTFYYLGLKGISVGGETLPVPESSFAVDATGGGGIIVENCKNIKKNI
ncbi:Protein ASPARTIC PROTEASE IN GUARD CELL 1 [Vigna angularis]|uniref:Protein ASPARTIC PROTEASE IN GUARD CELL 1 n=1 Tax=Phaseolus angularis TaxID=3914 RepID=A0A8T0JMK1_PHAAN|nr:Protein ASPARTIC PROTEASE IN GUARD CELL 1 [Vigna angularis]